MRQPHQAMGTTHPLRGVRRLALAPWLLLASGVVLAQQTPVASGVKVHLQVGEKKVLNVGLAMGLLCDDGTVVQAELHPASHSENELVLIGLKPGKTDCRAGTANVSRSRLVHVTVSAKQASP